MGAEKRSTHPSHQTLSPCVLSRMAGTSIHRQGYWLSSSLVQAGIFIALHILEEYLLSAANIMCFSPRPFADEQTKGFSGFHDSCSAIEPRDCPCE